jgi:hypothetical protein
MTADPGKADSGRVHTMSQEQLGKYRSGLSVQERVEGRPAVVPLDSPVHDEHGPASGTASIDAEYRALLGEQTCRSGRQCLLVIVLAAERLAEPPVLEVHCHRVPVT